MDTSVVIKSVELSPPGVVVGEDVVRISRLVVIAGGWVVETNSAVSLLAVCGKILVMVVNSWSDRVVKNISEVGFWVVKEISEDWVVNSGI